MATKAHTLCRLSIPPRLRHDMLLKEAFDVPNTEAGTLFLEWWRNAEPESRDRVMKVAHKHDMSVTDAQLRVENALLEDDE